MFAKTALFLLVAVMMLLAMLTTVEASNCRKCKMLCPFGQRWVDNVSGTY